MESKDEIVGTKNESRYRSSSRVFWVEVAEIVLSKSPQPLHSQEIVERAISEGLIVPRGRRPADSVIGAIWKDIHLLRKEKSPFVLVGTGRNRKYWLKGR